MATKSHHTGLRNQFLLDDTITFLNFGSFGACPKPVFEDYQRWQLLLEREPVQYIAFDGPGYLKKSREALAAYINCDADDVVYVTNPTYAINIIAHSLKLEPGDEILTTDLEYGAMDRTWNYYCDKVGARYVRQPIDLPVASKDAIIEQFWQGYSNKTKAVFISQITSTTAMILPVQEICAMAKERGLLTIVDGAHVPGHIPLDMAQIQADIYTGACHKWMMTPKGCTFLYVKRDLQRLFDPLVVSWGYKSATPSHTQFIDYHQMQGTRDFSVFLTVPAAIAFMQQNNWWDVARACREMVRASYPRFCNLLGTQPLCPLTDDHMGQMASIPIKTAQPERLQRLVFEQYRIEVPVMRHDAYTFLRYSINGFNTGQDLDQLYAALQHIMATTDFIST
jgi:isopenicillin-N epimerase